MTGLKSHHENCAQRHGGECTCGAFEHNERVYASETKAKYTPGPWHVNTAIRRQLYVEHANGFICDMQLDQANGESPETIQADARLIAAAPNLLATCEEELEALQTWLRAKLPVDVYEGVLISINKMTCAIREATNAE